MILLALDTSAKIASAALLRDGNVLAERHSEETRRHAETAAPMAEDVLRAAGLTVSDVDAFAVDIGPGSFTGVRIGVCLVNAMAYASGKHVLAVNALRTLYEGVREDSGRVCALLDAGNGNVYAAQYENGACVSEPAAETAEAYFKTVPAGTLFTGDAPDSLRALIAKTVQDARFSDAVLPEARNVAFAVLAGAGERVKQAIPMYLRPSQAERMWKLRQEEQK